MGRRMVGSWLETESRVERSGWCRLVVGEGLSWTGSSSWAVLVRRLVRAGQTCAGVSGRQAPARRSGWVGWASRLGWAAVIECGVSRLVRCERSGLSLGMMWLSLSVGRGLCRSGSGVSRGTARVVTSGIVVLVRSGSAGMSRAVEWVGRSCRLARSEMGRIVVACQGR